VSKSRCWRPSETYAPVTRAVEPCPSSFVSIHTLPRIEPNASADQSSVASRATTARWFANTQVESFSACAPT
jgi:hypothetical protein